MAERIVSPGVFTRENDLSFLAQGVGEIGAAFIGPFKQGPAFVPTIVRTQSEFEDIFGTPDGTYYTEYAVQNYLREAGQATIVRVAGIGGYQQAAPLAIFASGSSATPKLGTKLIGVLHSTKVGDEAVGFTGATVVSDDSIDGSFVINTLTAGVNISASILPSATNDLADVFGESPFGAKSAYAYSYFENMAGYYTGSAGNNIVITRVVLPTQEFGDASEAETPIVVSQLISGERYNLFKFETIGHGTLYNTRFKVGISNVKAAGEDGSTDYSTFTVTIRSFSDTDKRKSVVETFNNVNLDPASPNYIARRIGDRKLTIDSNGKLTENGDYTNKSKYVRVVVQDANSNILGPGSYPISAAPFGHSAYTNPIKATDNAESLLVPAVVFQTNSTGNTSSSPIYYSGFDFETTGVSIDNKQYLRPIPTNAETGSNVVFAFDSQLNYVMTGSASTDMVKRQFVLGFQFGFDGTNPTVKIAKAGDADWGNANTQGFNCATAASSGSVAYTKAINAVSNPDEYDINMVVTPGIVRQLHPAITSKVIDMVEDRQDCFYIADFNDYDDTITEATEQANLVDSNYVATYYPWVKTIDSNTNKLTSVPPSTLLPAVYAANDRLAAEWFAPAGLNRGGITGAVSVLNRLTHSERDTLYENKVNPIAAFPGQGIVAFGQKTLQDKASALDRINVRRLLINLKKFVASTSRFLVFEQNTSTTRNRFLNTVNPYLESVQQRQGLYTFKVVMDESNNTPDVIDRNILAGQIFLQPAKTAEFIVIDFNILPTGASFSA
jgi:phage tail sheath protein FI